MKKPVKVKTKIIKYLAEKAKGKNKKDAAISAGYSPATALHHMSRLENTTEYKNARDAFSASLSQSFLTIAGKDPLKSLGDGLVETSLQDSDKAARLKAIELALSYFGINADQPQQSNNLIVIGLSGYSKEDGGDEKGNKTFTFRG